MGDIVFLIIVWSFFLGIVAIAVYNIYDMFRTIVLFFLKDKLARWLLFRKLNAKSKIFLQQNFSYYRRLPDHHKKFFEKRVQKFMDMKEFVPRGELAQVTIEMKTLIAASAIQITFGLPSVYLTHFYKILVYPNDYYSTITKHYHRGEVNSRGFIVLSWTHLLQGYMNDSDGRNLGLHEMAHALRIADAYVNDEQDFFDRKTFIKFLSHSRAERTPRTMSR